MNTAGDAAPAPRIGIFGGTFDPVHRGHLALARAALQTLALDEVRWVPAGQPWQKAGQAITPALHREAMLRLALQGEPRFVLDRCELERAGPSYMIDTLDALQAQRPQARWWLLLGADQCARLPTWHRWQDLLQRVALAVAARPGFEPPQALAGQAFTPLPMAADEVSATEIRRCAAAGRPLDDLVAPEVARYIARHHLYGAPPTGAAA